MRLAHAGGVAIVLPSNELEPVSDARRHPEHGVTVADVVFVLLTVAVFALIGLIARGAERL